MANDLDSTPVETESNSSSSLFPQDLGVNHHYWFLRNLFLDRFRGNDREIPPDGESRSYAVCCVSGSDSVKFGRPPVISEIRAEIAGKGKLRSMTCVAPINLRS